MYYDLHWSKNSYSNQFKSDMEDFILVIIMLQLSDEGFDSGKKHVLDICTKSYSNGLGAIQSPPYNFLTH